MTEPGTGATPRTPGTEPGERRLVRPPSDRYRPLEPDPVIDRSGSPARAIGLALAVTLVGAAVITILGGILAVSAGLLVVAGAIGWAVALGLRVGAGPTLAPGRATTLAVRLAGLAVALGQVGLWLFARAEGGVLGPLDYLGETFGALVPAEFVIASLVAWLAAR